VNNVDSRVQETLKDKLHWVNETWCCCLKNRAGSDALFSDNLKAEQKHSYSWRSQILH